MQTGDQAGFFRRLGAASIAILTGRRALATADPYPVGEATVAFGVFGTEAPPPRDGLEIADRGPAASVDLSTLPISQRKDIEALSEIYEADLTFKSEVAVPKALAAAQQPAAILRDSELALRMYDGSDPPGAVTVESWIRMVETLRRELVRALRDGGTAEAPPENPTVEEALIILERAVQDGPHLPDWGGDTFADVSHDLRWRMHVLACSIQDMTFWVERVDDESWQATEVETGVSGEPAASAREALDNYWRI